jgi:hypothetical protein
MAATHETAGLITPTVSHVSYVPSGGLGKMHAKQAVLPGRIVMVVA